MKKRILIVDDERLNRDIMQKILRNDYELAVAESGEGCLEAMREFGPDLVLLDVMMPGIDGYEACDQIKTSPGGELVQIILVSGKASTQDRLRGYEVGADDYLVKPFDHDELKAKIRIQFRLRSAHRDLAAAHAKISLQNEHLESVVKERTEEIVEVRDVTVFALAKLAESRDPETGEHLERMRSYCQVLAEYMSENGPYSQQIDEQFLDDLYRSSPLHDIGKVGIPDVILLKPDRLTDHEFDIMKRHTTIGAEALAEAAGRSDSGGFLNMAAMVARSHHERFNGSGYPDGLSGRDSPLAARIVALADVYDALTSVRVYKAAFEPEVSRAMIEQEAGEHFDSVVVEAFQATYEKFLEIWRIKNDTVEPESSKKETLAATA